MATRQPQDPLVSDTRLCAELGIAKMTAHRWRKRGILPAPTVIGGRNYTRLSVVERLKNEGDGSAPQRVPGGDAA